MRKTTEEWLNERRLEMLVTWDDLAELADINPHTLRRIRNEQTVRALQATKLEDAVGWEHGTLKRIKQGQAPVIHRRPEDRETDHVPILDSNPPELHNDAERRFWEGMSSSIPYESKILMLQLYRRERRWGEETQRSGT